MVYGWLIMNDNLLSLNIFCTRLLIRNVYAHNIHEFISKAFQCFSNTKAVHDCVDNNIKLHEIF